MFFKLFDFSKFLQLSCFCLLFALVPKTASAQIIVILEDGCSHTYNQSQIEISFSPNPADNAFTLSNTEGLQMNQAIIRDANGYVVLQKNLNGKTNETIQTSELPEGNYALTVTTDCGTGTAQLIIVH